MNPYRPLSMSEAEELLGKIKFRDEVIEQVKHADIPMGEFLIVERFRGNQLEAIMNYVRLAVRLENGSALPDVYDNSELGTMPRFIGTSEDCGSAAYLNMITESRRS